METRNKKYLLFVILIIITLLTVVCGVIFSARNFTTSCKGAINENTDSQIRLITKSECEYKSVFLLSERKLKSKIESSLPQVEVISIERVFPDTIKVNYRIKKTYAYIIVDGKYKYISKDGKVLSTDGGERANEESLIEIKTDETLSLGKFVFQKNSLLQSYVFELLDLMERMAIDNLNELIAELDFTRLSANTLKIVWREGATVYIEYPSINFKEKVRLFASALTSCSKEKREQGVWRVYSDKISYAEK